MYSMYLIAGSVVVIFRLIQHRQGIDPEQDQLFTVGL
jgi:hypothetical protein